MAIRESGKSNHPIRLAALVSHPIQYQAPMFRALAKRHEIDLTVLFCTDWGYRSRVDEGFGQPVKWDVPLLDGYKSVFLPNHSPIAHPSTFWGLINPSVLGYVTRARYEALWIHGWSGFTHGLALLTAFLRNVPVVLRAETTLLPSLPPWKAGLKRIFLSRFFNHVSAFLTIGRYNADFYRSYGVSDDKLTLVPYAVDNEFFVNRARDLKSRKTEMKRALGIPENLPVILFSGKLWEPKRPLDLLAAYAQICQTTNAALVYLGDGPQRARLETFQLRHALKHVYFVGFKNQTEMPSIYAIADVFVLPSGFEPWGLVVNEAMCFGLPVIVTDQVGCAGDLIREGENGFIYPVGDVSALAERLLRLLGNEQERKNMGKVSQAMIAPWSYDADVKAIVTCLMRLTRNG